MIVSFVYRFFVFVPFLEERYPKNFLNVLFDWAVSVRLDGSRHLVCVLHRPNIESFAQAFSKACEVKGEEPLAPVATGETLLRRFLFVSFSFAPEVSKEKDKDAKRIS